MKDLFTMVYILDIHFLCLGDWESHTGDRYLALMDLREEPEARPKYRCGVSAISSSSIVLLCSPDEYCLLFSYQLL
jgi:hypothetical protein